MPRDWYLGKDCEFTFTGDGVGGGTVANDDVRDVTVTIEPGATARLTTRGSGEFEEEVAIRSKIKLEVQVTDHTCDHREIGVVTMVRSPVGPAVDLTGKYQLANIGEPQTLDGEIVFALTFHRYVNS